MLKVEFSQVLKSSFYAPRKKTLKISANLVNVKAVQVGAKFCMGFWSRQYGEIDHFCILLDKNSETQSNNPLSQIYVAFYLGNNFVEHCKTIQLNLEKLLASEVGCFLQGNMCRVKWAFHFHAVTIINEFLLTCKLYVQFLVVQERIFCIQCKKVKI